MRHGRYKTYGVLLRTTGVPHDDKTAAAVAQRISHVINLIARQP